MSTRIRFTARVALLVAAALALALLSPAIPAGGDEGDDKDEGGAIGWLRQVASPGFADESARAVDSDGLNVYVAGDTSGALPGQTSAGNLDAFVRSSDLATGTAVGWTVQFGTSGEDTALGVAADGGGGVYVVGNTQGALNFPSLSLTGIVDAYVVRFDASTGAVLWADQFGSVGKNTRARGVTVAPTGDVYVVGNTNGSLPGHTNLGQSDAFVRKYTAAGTEVWTDQFGTTDIDAAWSVAVSADGSAVYVAGGLAGGDAFVEKRDAMTGNKVFAFGTGGTVQFGGFTAGVPNFDRATGVTVAGSVVWVAGFAEGGTLDLVPGLSFQGGNSDAFVAAFDAGTGAVLCADQFGTQDDDFANGISAAPGGSVFVAGQTSGTNLLPGALGALGGSFDGFVRRYDVGPGPGTLFCTPVGTRHVGSMSVDAARGISADASGLVVVGSTVGTFPGQTSKGSADAFAQRLDLAGSVVWTDQFGNPGRFPAFDRAADVDIDQDGNAYVVGDTGGTLPGQVTALLRDAWVQMYDAGGTVVWTDQFGTPGNDQAQGVDVDARQGVLRVFVAGFTASALVPGAHSGSADAFVRVYDALTGQEIWTRQFGTAGPDVARRVKADATGVYVSGFTQGTLESADGTPQTNAGGRDCFVRKYDSDGTELWTRQFGSGGFQDAYGFTLDRRGNVFVVGWTDGPALPGAVLAPGKSNAFVRMYDTDGNHVWTRQFGSEGAFSYATGVSVHASKVFVVGVTRGSLPGPNAGLTDVFVHRFNTAGNLVWARQFGTPSHERHPPGGNFGSSPQVSAGKKGLLVAAATSGTLPGQTSAGGFDAFVQRFRHNGRTVWTLQFGTPANDGVLGVSLDDSDDDSVGRVVGVTQGVLTPGPNQGATDAFVVEIIVQDDDDD